MPFVEVEDGVRIWVQDVGSGAPVVLIPGFGFSVETWDRQVRTLAEHGYRVLCVDQRGHGASDKPFAGYSVQRMSLDLGVVLDALDARGCTLVGWSLGGQVAFQLVAADPAAAARLCLVASNGVRASRRADYPFGPPAGPALEALVAGETSDRLAARRSTIASIFGTPPDEALLTWLVHCSMRMPSWAAVACYRARLETDLIDQLPRVRIPVLQIVGDRDPAQSLDAVRWVDERLADSAIVELAGCGHYPMFEAPDRFDRALLAFAGSGD